MKSTSSSTNSSRRILLSVLGVFASVFLGYAAMQAEHAGSPDTFVGPPRSIARAEEVIPRDILGCFRARAVPQLDDVASHVCDYTFELRQSGNMLGDTEFEATPFAAHIKGTFSITPSYTEAGAPVVSLTPTKVVAIDGEDGSPYEIEASGAALHCLVEPDGRIERVRTAAPTASDEDQLMRLIALRALQRVDSERERWQGPFTDETGPCTVLWTRKREPTSDRDSVVRTKLAVAAKIGEIPVEIEVLESSDQLVYDGATLFSAHCTERLRVDAGGITYVIGLDLVVERSGVRPSERSIIPDLPWSNWDSLRRWDDGGDHRFGFEEALLAFAELETQELLRTPEGHRVFAGLMRTLSTDEDALASALDALASGRVAPPEVSEEVHMLVVSALADAAGFGSDAALVGMQELVGFVPGGDRLVVVGRALHQVADRAWKDKRALFLAALERLEDAGAEGGDLLLGLGALLRNVHAEDRLAQRGIERMRGFALRHDLLATFITALGESRHVDVLMREAWPERDHQDAVIRERVFEVLALAQGEERATLALVLGLSSDPEASVRRAAISALTLHRTARGDVAIERALRFDEEDLVRRAGWQAIDEYRGTERHWLDLAASRGCVDADDEVRRIATELSAARR